MSKTTTIKAGNLPQTIVLNERSALNVVGAPNTVGVAYLLDQVLGGVNAIKQWAIGVGAIAQIGPFVGAQKIMIVCSAGSIDATEFDAAVTAPIMVIDATGNVTGLAGPQGQIYGLGIFNATATDMYGFALRSSQPGFDTPKDQSGKLNDPLINASLVPQVRLNSTNYTAGQYRSPAVLSGKLYKCTTTGVTASSEPAGMGAAAVGATVADGAAVWTVERGPWFATAAGFQHFTSINSTLLPARGSIDCPAILWNMAVGDSLVGRIKLAFSAATDARVALSETAVLGNRHTSTARAGVQLTATGTPFSDLRLLISDGTNSVQSGHFATAFARKVLDGTVREVLFAIDGPTKRLYFWIDGIPPTQSDMFDVSNPCPHGLDLSTVTGATTSANPVTFGGVPGSSASADFGAIALDIVVLPGRALPANMQAIADFFYSRGAAALLPAGMLI